MPIRGRIAVDDQGRLVMIDPSADREAIDAADIQPLSVDDLLMSGQLTGESGRTYVDDETETVGDGQTSADHETVSTDELNTPPTGTLVQLSTDQSVPDNTLTTIEWASDSSRGGVSGLLDTQNNVVVVPPGFSHAKITINLHWESPADEDSFSPVLNGVAGFAGSTGNVPQSGPEVANWELQSAWVPVSQGDEIGARLRHISGASRTIQNEGDTWMEVWLL